MVKMFVDTWDEHGAKVKRVGSPVLFFLMCVIMFFVFLMADQHSCIRGQNNRAVLRQEASVDYTVAGYWATHGRPTLALVYSQRARYEDVPQLRCPMFFPQVHGRSTRR